MKKEHNGKVSVSQKFITAMAIVSIIEFTAIVSQTIFGYNVENYTEAFLMLIIGGGLIFEAKIKKLASLSHGITSNNITHLTTVIVGVVAILAGIFSFPPIRIENSAFLAIKGIISLIAIAVIIIQTWVIK